SRGSATGRAWCRTCRSLGGGERKERAGACGSGAVHQRFLKYNDRSLHSQPGEAWRRAREPWHCRSLPAGDSCTGVVPAGSIACRQAPTAALFRRGDWAGHCGSRLRLRYTPALVRPLSETSSTLSASAAKSRNIPRKAERAAVPSRRSRELLLIALAAVVFYLFICLASYHPRDP